MANTYMHISKRLQTACRKLFGVKLLINSRQWYNEQRDMAMTLYTVQQVIYNEDSDKKQYVELFKTYSQIQLLLFMRDFWYKLNSWEVPTNNEKWEAIKNQYEREQTPSDIEPSEGDGTNSRYTVNSN